MQKIFSFILCVTALSVQAGDNTLVTHSSSSNLATFAGSSNDPGTLPEMRININDLDHDLPQDPPYSPHTSAHMPTNISIARFVTQAVNHNKTTRAPHLYTSPSTMHSEDMTQILFKYLNKIEQQNPELHQFHMNTILGHHENVTRTMTHTIGNTASRSTTLRNRNVPTPAAGPETSNTASAALADAEPATTQLLNDALQSNHQEQAEALADKDLTIAQKDAKFWVNLAIVGGAAVVAGVASLTASAVAIIQALGLHA